MDGVLMLIGGYVMAGICHLFGWMDFWGVCVSLALISLIVTVFEIYKYAIRCDEHLESRLREVLDDHRIVRNLAYSRWQPNPLVCGLRSA
jgi:hypothetical protein